MSFDSIIGHDRAITVLKRALANKTLAHAYIFSGIEGVGKRLTATALAQAVNCRTAGAAGCGICVSCKKIAASGHPDLHLVAPDGNEIKIDQVRHAQADLALKPFEGDKKVLIVDGAEAMNPASANAFLKTLEEPPGDTLIVLITSRPHALLPTIRSRCQEIRFLPLTRRELAEAMIRTRRLSETDAWFLAALAQGSMGRAMGMDLEREKADRAELFGLWSQLPDMSAADLLASAEALSKDRERLEQLIDTGTELIRDAIVLRESGDEKLLVNSEGRALHRQWAERHSLQRMLQDLDLLVMSRGLLERRVSGQLVAENLLLKLARE